MSKKLYKIIFLRKFNEELNIVKTIETNNLKETYRIDNKTFVININNVSHIDKLQKCYFIDFDSGSQHSLSEVKAEMNPKQLDTIVGTKLIKELASGIVDNKKEKILLIIVGFIIGIILGLLIMQIIYSGKIEELMLDQLSTPIVYPFDSSINFMRSI